MARGSIPKITWGSSFINTLTFGYPLDQAVSYPIPREGSEWIRSSSGFEDAWIVGEDYILEGSVRWIPTTTTASQTGWDSTTGWSAFLSWARQKNTLRYYPDRAIASYISCYLMEPMNGAPELEDDGSRKLRLKFISTTEFTGF